MNGLKEIQGHVKNFICEKEKIQKQIVEIEEKRTQMAQQRNEIKASNSDWENVCGLGKQITQLGNQSQGLQNQLDFNCRTIKTQINLIIDNLIAEGIRKIRILNEEIKELQQKNENQKERNAKYQLQKEEFFLRFGRMPELSERAAKENKLQEKEASKNLLEIDVIKGQISKAEGELGVLAKIKRYSKNGNWNSIIEEAEVSEEIYIEEITIGEIEPIEEIYVEEFGPVEELYVEEFKPIEEIKIEAFEEGKEFFAETFEPIEENSMDEIEKLAREIVAQIVAEQTKDLESNIKQIEEEPTEKEEEEEGIIIFEKENEKNEKIIIPLFGQRATISNIVVKFENGSLVYKAQMSDKEEIKIYPSKLGEESVLLRDKQNREDCKEILVNYAVKEHKVFDRKVINKIDPLVCELLIECAERYGHNAQELVYNYAASFFDGNVDMMPGIIYNLSYIEQSNLSRREKAIINKIARNARKNNGIDIIESFSGFRKFKYIFKRLFAINNVKVLPESKY